MAKQALGRGLSALLGEDTARTTSVAPAPNEIDIDLLARAEFFWKVGTDLLLYGKPVLGFTFGKEKIIFIEVRVRGRVAGKQRQPVLSEDVHLCRRNRSALSKVFNPDY